MPRPAMPARPRHGDCDQRMADVSDEPELSDSGTTETTVRHFDPDGTLTSETVTVVTHRSKPDDERGTGMYL